MTIDIGTPDNPSVLTPVAGTAVINRMYVRENQRLRTSRREIYRVPGLRQRFEESGGFETVFAADAETEESLEAVDRVASIQSAAILDQMANGDIDNVPKLEEMYATSQDNNNKLIDISSHLTDCCEDIKGLLRELRVLVKSQHDKLVGIIKSSRNSIILNINNKYEDIISLYNSEKIKFIDKYSSEKTSILSEIKSVIHNEIDPLNKKLNDLENKLDNALDKIHQDLNDIKGEVIDLKNPINDIQHKADDIKSTTNIINTSANEILGELSGFISSWELYYLDFIEFKADAFVAIGGVTAAITTEIGTLGTFLKAKIILDNEEVKIQISKAANSINKETSTKFNDFKKYSDHQFEILPRNSALETSLYVVGEAFTRWDSVTTYFPCVVFVFNEPMPTLFRRKSQIKLRLNVLNRDITPEIISNLEKEILKLRNLEYIYGPNRGYYVSADKRFKTIVYAKDKENQENVLKKLFISINENFDSSLLSTTFVKSKRPNIIKRNAPLIETNINNYNYNENITLRLRKATLLVNGLEKPINLFCDSSF